jgi:hypothetical protein
MELKIILIHSRNEKGQEGDIIYRLLKRGKDKNYILENYKEIPLINSGDKQNAIRRLIILHKSNKGAKQYFIKNAKINNFILISNGDLSNDFRDEIEKRSGLSVFIEFINTRHEIIPAIISKWRTVYGLEPNSLQKAVNDVITRKEPIYLNSLSVLCQAFLASYAEHFMQNKKKIADTSIEKALDEMQWYQIRDGLNKNGNTINMAKKYTTVAQADWWKTIMRNKDTLKIIKEEWGLLEDLPKEVIDLIKEIINRSKVNPERVAKGYLALVGRLK